MSKRGFDYKVGDSRRAGMKDSGTHVDYEIYGDLEAAKRDGLGDFAKRTDSGDEELSADEKAADPAAGLSPKAREAYFSALFGPDITPMDTNDPDVISIDHSDGSGASMFRASACRTIGEQEVTGDIRKWRAASMAFQWMSNEVISRIEADPRSKSLDQKWADCMNKAGFGRSAIEDHVRSLWAKVNSGTMAADQAKQASIPIAVANAKCEIDLGFAKFHTEMRAEYEPKVLAASQGVIARYAELRNAAVAKAKQRLAR